MDKDVRAELLTLSKEAADKVARHLVAAGQVIDEDPDLAMAHAIAARRMASRIAAVREAVGLAAYAAGDWATAIAELRTYHRMTGRQTHLAELADCERALGRPERAIDLYRGADRDALDKAGAIELLIVAAGARADLGQYDAAVAMLQVRELTVDDDAEWAARLRYAYADALLAAGRRDEAREWFSRTAAIDHDEVTDAPERLLELDGITLEDEPDIDESGQGTAAPDESDMDGSPMAPPMGALAFSDGTEDTVDGDEHFDEGDHLDDPAAEDDPGEPHDRLADDVDGDIDRPWEPRSAAHSDEDEAGPAGPMADTDDEKALEDEFVAEVHDKDGERRS